MKIAFCATELHLPPRDGLDIHTTQMGRALARRGHDVRFFSQRAEGAHLLELPHETLGSDSCCDAQTRSGDSRLRAWLSEYRGATPARLETFRRTIREGRFDACVYSGVEGLAWLAGIRGCARVWYVADDLVLSCVSNMRLRSRVRDFSALLREAVISGVYELTFRHDAEAMWVVSERDGRWLSCMTGGRPVDNIPNGVDVDFFTCVQAEVRPHRIAFWGSLDFAANQAALEWFLPAVWDPLRNMVPDAEMCVIGRRPPAWIRRATDRPGVSLLADLPDLRPHVCSAPIAVFPIRGGSGIKNKFLEGASLGRALLAAPPVLAGLHPADGQAWIRCDRPTDWLSEIQGLWKTPERIRGLGSAARKWAETYYTWNRAALQAEGSIELAIARSRLRSLS